MSARRRWFHVVRAVTFTAAVAVSVGPSAFALEYQPPGDLAPSSGDGREDDTVYVPGMRFPLELAPAFANSQVYGHGGNFGPGGGQCDAENYSFPWRDNFCEERVYETPLCPSGNGHQGQDIRPSTCSDDTWWAVAAEDGEITGIGSYSVILTSDAGTQYRYLHMSMDRLAVEIGDRVERGDRLGLVSTDFGDTGTTIHLHFEMLQYVAEVGGITHVPPYMSLVRSYEELEGEQHAFCEPLDADGGVVDDGDRYCVTLFGSGRFWRSVDGFGTGGGLSWTHAFAGSAPSNWARWQTPMAASGRYDVEVADGSAWIAANGFDQTRAAVYRVRHAGEETDMLVDQTSGEGGWVSLGEFEFEEGGDQWVAVFDDTGEDGALERKIVVDAVRLTRVDDEGCGPIDSAWRSAGACVAGVDSGCAGNGTRAEVRETCVGGQVTEESRQVDCVRDTDGLVISDWSAWSTCTEGVRERSRSVCDGGEASAESETEPCEGRTPGTSRARSGSGCSSSSSPVGFAWAAVLLILVPRRRR